MGNPAATWEGNRGGGGDGGGDFVAPGGPTAPLLPPHTDMETPNTTYINLDRVDTSRTVGDVSPGP